MFKHTFTIFNSDDSIYGYLFDVTRTEAQTTVSQINKEESTGHYYMEGYFE